MSRRDAIRLGTRGSKLALTQSQQVADALSAAHGGLRVDLEIIKTTGDRITDVPLSRIGDKGLFTKEIEVALLDGSVDFAVHSMKDMPTALPEGLVVGAVPRRKPPFDCLISLAPGGIAGLAEGARVATGSLRRRAQLRHARPDLVLEEMRGNVTTRIRKMVDSALDGIVLALAGLSRLGVDGLEAGTPVTFTVPPDWDEALAGTRVHITPVPFDICLPAVGQGALCLETRAGDDEIVSLLSVVDDAGSHAEVCAERALMRALEGGCQVPIAARAVAEGGRLRLQAMVATLDGRRRIVAEREGSTAEAERIGIDAAAALRAQGADVILAEIRGAPPS